METIISRFYNYQSWWIYSMNILWLSDWPDSDSVSVSSSSLGVTGPGDGVLGTGVGVFGTGVFCWVF